MVHLSKLAVGIRDVSHLTAVQASRLQQEGRVLHRTRMAPRRAADLLGGGSLYWVIAGVMLVRQRLLAIEPDRRESGAPCVALILEPALQPVAPRVVRAFQGWRYLEPGDAPPDLDRTPMPSGEHLLPEPLLRALRLLALL